MSKKSCYNDNSCCNSCYSFDNSGCNNYYIWILLIILLFTYGNFWYGYNDAFASSGFNCNTFSNSNINNFFGNNYYN